VSSPEKPAQEAAGLIATQEAIDAIAEAASVAVQALREVLPEGGAASIYMGAGNYTSVTLHNLGAWMYESMPDAKVGPWYAICHETRSAQREVRVLASDGTWVRSTQTLREAGLSWRFGEGEE
jgi:hypothetical protein